MNLENQTIPHDESETVLAQCVAGRTVQEIADIANLIKFSSPRIRANGDVDVIVAAWKAAKDGRA